MNKYIFPIIKWKIKPWLKYYILNKSATSYPLSEIIEGTSPLTLENSIRKKFHIFNVSGNTVQNGDPTPETPVPVENVSGEVEVKVENKNLFDKNNVVYVNNKILNDSGVEINDSTGGYTKMYIPVSSSTEWTISGLSTSGAKRIYYFDEDKKLISRSAAFTNSYLTFTTPEKCKYVDIQYYITGNNFNTYQLEQGSDTSYESHEEQTATLHLPEGMEMCKSKDGTYRDGFVWQNNKHYKKKVIYEEDIKDRLNLISVNDRKVDYCQFLTPVLTYVPVKLGYSNITEVNTDGFTSAYKVRFNVPYSILGTTQESTLAEQKTALLNLLANVEKVIFTYVLATPVLEEITDPTLISDLESLKNLYSYKGTTHISSTNEPSPIFEVQYYMEEGA